MAGPRPILIDARAAARAQIGGVERWAREMATRLPRLRPDTYLVARPPSGFAHRAGHVWEQVALPARARRQDAGLVYCPANLGPLTGPGNALLLHDVAALRHPEWYSRGYVAWQRRIVPALARRARAVVTVSEFSRREIAEAIGLDPERIAVVAGGVSEGFHPGVDPEPVRTRLELERPYVLTLSTRYPRKNQAALGETARRLRALGVDLVAAGGERSYMRAGNDGAGVRSLGYVPDELLPGLYAGASAFAFVSLDEGFGLPCLEAMAAGVPVVAADSGALPDTCGGAALLVDPDDPSAVADAVERVLARPEELRPAGLERASTLSWDRAARETDALLARLSSDR